MRRTVPLLVIASLLFLAGGILTGGRAEDKVPLLPEEAKWGLARDYKIDGKLEDLQNVDDYPLLLTNRENQLSGHYEDKKANKEHNDSTFTGEIVSREKPLLILRQEHKNKDGTYVVIHSGHLVGENHYRGVWHDNSGQSGDFELKLRK